MCPEKEERFLEYEQVHALMTLFRDLQPESVRDTLTGKLERFGALLKLMQLSGYQFSDRQAMFNAIREFPELEGLRR